MTINIDRFKSSIGFDLQRPSLYYVRVFPPQKISETAPNSMIRNITLMCKEAVWPGKSYGTFESRTYGPLTKLPYDIIYTEVTLSFHRDTASVAPILFDTWHKLIQPGSKGGWEYYDNYIGEIEIGLLDRSGYVTDRVLLQEAYPSVVPDQPLSAENNDQTMIYSVTFQFREIKKLEPTKERIVNI